MSVLPARASVCGLRRKNARARESVESDGLVGVDDVVGVVVTSVGVGLLAVAAWDIPTVVMVLFGTFFAGLLALLDLEREHDNCRLRGGDGKGNDGVRDLSDNEAKEFATLHPSDCCWPCWLRNAAREAALTL